MSIEAKGRLLVAAVAALSTGAAGCGDGAHSTEAGPVSVDGVTVLIAEHETGGDAPEALLEGTIRIVNDCLVVIEVDGADGSLPLFPAGTVVEAGPTGPIVMTPVGELTVGDVVGLGGGFIGGLGGDLGGCEGVVPGEGFSVFTMNH